MNAKFVPDARREEVTWIGSMGIVVRNSAYKDSNATKLRFEVEGKRIFVDDKVVLKAKNVEKLVFSNGKLTISETESISGASTSTLTITGVTESNEGGYRCVVTNSAGTATSNTATLTVGM